MFCTFIRLTSAHEITGSVITHTLRTPQHINIVFSPLAGQFCSVTLALAHDPKKTFASYRGRTFTHQTTFLLSNKKCQSTGRKEYHNMENYTVKG